MGQYFVDGIQSKYVLKEIYERANTDMHMIVKHFDAKFKIVFAKIDFFL